MSKRIATDGTTTEPERARAPSHPGEFITEILNAHGLTVAKAARKLHVGRPVLSNLLHGDADLSPKMALRIEKAFGVRVDTLMRMQTTYDIWLARQHGSLVVDQ